MISGNHLISQITKEIGKLVCRLDTCKRKDCSILCILTVNVRTVQSVSDYYELSNEHASTHTSQVKSSVYYIRCVSMAKKVYFEI